MVKPLALGTGIRRRAAFDIGSGATKLQVADVDLASRHLVTSHYARERMCKFSLDWKSSDDGTLSEAIQEKGLRILHELKAIAEGLEVQEYSAIATEVFRKAKNGEAYLRRVKEEVGLTVQLISQREEAELGLLTAVAFTSAKQANEVVAWDSGSASFQITRYNDKMEVEGYVAPIGAGVATAWMIEKAQGLAFSDSKMSPNPVTAHQAESLVSIISAALPDPPQWLVGLPDVVAIGGPDSIFCLAHELTGGRLTLTAEDVRCALRRALDRTDNDMPELTPSIPSMVVPKLVLLTAVLQRASLPSFTYQPAVGSCAGMLVLDRLYLNSG